MAVPWLQLVKFAPTIISLTNDILKRSRTAAPPAEAGLDERVRVMEEDLRRQAEALHALAGQMEGLTSAVAALRARRSPVGTLTFHARPMRSSPRMVHQLTST